MVRSEAPLWRVHALYELNRREVLPLLLLGRCMQAEGIDFEIEQLKLASNRLRIGPRERTVRLLPFHYNDDDVRYSLSFARWTGREAAIDLCWEQMRNSWNRVARRPRGMMIGAGMIYMAWGPKFRAELLASGVAPEQICVTGNMRFDLPRHPDLLLSRGLLAKQYDLDHGRPWLLIPWNLHFAQGSALQQLLASCKHSGLPFPEHIVNIARRTREHFFELVHHLRQKYPDWEIILRGHPSAEDVQTLCRLTSGANGVHLIQHGDIMHWIVQATAVVGWSSTALMEAIAADVPTLCFEPVAYSEPLDYDVGRIAPRATCLDEALEKLAAPDRLRGAVSRELFAAWYGEVDGRAHHRVADLCRQVLADLPHDSIPRDIVRRKTSTLRNAARRMIQNAPRCAPLLRWYAHGSRARPSYWIPPAVVAGLLRGDKGDRFSQWLW